VCSVTLEETFSVCFLNVRQIFNSGTVAKQTHQKCYVVRTFPSSFVTKVTMERNWPCVFVFIKSVWGFK
jgi:hypothetical protein